MDLFYIPTMKDIESGRTANEALAVATGLARTRRLLEGVGVVDGAGLTAFMTEVLRISKAKSDTLIYTYIYLGRLVQAHPDMAVGRDDSGHCLFLTAAMLAHKMSYDSPYTNRAWSRIARYSGLPFDLAQVNAMEREMLDLLSFNVYVSDAEYSAFYSLMTVAADVDYSPATMVVVPVAPTPSVPAPVSIQAPVPTLAAPALSGYKAALHSYPAGNPVTSYASSNSYGTSINGSSSTNYGARDVSMTPEPTSRSDVSVALPVALPAGSASTYNELPTSSPASVGGVNGANNRTRTKRATLKVKSALASIDESAVAKWCAAAAARCGGSLAGSASSRASR